MHHMATARLRIVLAISVPPEGGKSCLRASTAQAQATRFAFT